MIDLSYGIVLMSGAKSETYEPGTLNWSAEAAPSPPNTFAFLPCSSSCWAKFCAAGRRLRREEHEVCVARDLGHERREVRHRIGNRQVSDRDVVGLEDCLGRCSETL